MRCKGVRVAAFRQAICAAAIVSIALAGPLQRAFAEGAAYTASPGDILQITVYGDNGLSGRFPVDADGAISYPLLGNVSVAGRTMSEISALLSKPLAERVPGATVSASVSQYAPVFIVGDVQSPGKYEYRPGMIALELIAMAGGLGRLDGDVKNAALQLVEMRQEYADLDIQLFSLRIKRARLQAELDESEFLVADAAAPEVDLRSIHQKIIDGEKRIFEIRRNTLKTNGDALAAQQASYDQEIATLQQSIKLHDEEITLLEQDVKAARTLADRALTSQSNLRLTERQLSETRRDGLEMRTYLARAQQNRLALAQQREMLSEQRKDDAAASIQGIDIDIARMSRKQDGLTAAMAQIAAGAQSGPAASAGASVSLSVMRSAEGTFDAVPANETVSLKPGDILRVTFVTARSGRQASAG